VQLKAQATGDVIAGAHRPDRELPISGIGRHHTLQAVMHRPVSPARDHDAPCCVRACCGDRVLPTARNVDMTRDTGIGERSS
jgi:hypothetical protein